MMMEPSASLHDAYQLFFALLTPTEYGGVAVPRHFARPFKNGICKSIWERKTGEPLTMLPDTRYATGLIEEPMRGTLDLLLEKVLDVVENDPSDYFTSRGEELQFRNVSDARLAHHHARTIYGEEYAQLYDAFPAAFAHFALPADEERIMVQLGRKKPDYSLPANPARFSSVI